MRGADRWIRWGLLAFAYLYVFPSYPALNNPNENARLYMTAALVEVGTYRVDAIRERWGWTNDCACVDTQADGSRTPCETPQAAPGAERHYFSVKAPATSFLAIPGYAAYLAWAGPPGSAGFEREEALWAARASSTILPMLAFGFFFMGWVRRFAADAALAEWTSVALLFGSVLYGYSLLFVSHSTSGAVALLAFALLRDAHRRPREDRRLGSAFAAGLLSAGVSLFEYPGFLVSVTLSFYALFVYTRDLRARFPSLLLFGLGALVPTLALMHFQHVAYGSALTPGHRFVETAAFRAIHETGFFGIASFHTDAAVRLLFDRQLGLLTLSPFFALAPLGSLSLLRQRARRAEGMVLSVATYGLYLAVCLLENWDGGWSIGPRYLVTVLPFAALLALAGLESVARRSRPLALALAFGSTAAGLAASATLSAYYPHLPPPLRAPLPDLVALLWAHDFAPYTAANPLGLHGSSTMLPLALVAGVALLLPLRLLRPRERLLAPLGLLLSAVILAPQLVATEPRPDESRALVVRAWNPEGHDRAAQLEAAVAAADDDDVEPLLRALVETYEREGRLPEAARARRRAERATRAMSSPP